MEVYRTFATWAFTAQLIFGACVIVVCAFTARNDTDGADWDQGDTANYGREPKGKV